VLCCVASKRPTCDRLAVLIFVHASDGDQKRR
jgi:hypothetical protein